MTGVADALDGESGDRRSTRSKIEAVIAKLEADVRKRKADAEATARKLTEEARELLRSLR